MKEIKKEKDFLQNYLKTFRPTGWEKDGAELFMKEMLNLQYVQYGFMDSMWNAGVCIGYDGDDAINVMISGHQDQNCLMISEITKNGFCKFISQGGISPKVLVDTNMVIYANEGETKIPCFCGIKAIHLEKPDDRKKAPEMNDLYLDLGCDSKEEVMDMGVRVGDLVMLDNSHNNIEFGKDGKYIVASGVDDGIGIQVVYTVFKNIDVQKLIENKIKLWGVALSGEEVGLRGVGPAVRKIQPNISIDIDVTHDNVTEIGKSDTGNNVRCGKGVVIFYGPDKRRDLNKELIDVAIANGIDYQVEAGKAGGTNTASIQTMSDNCKTTLLSIPNLYMHSASHEKVSWDDVQNCAKLLIKWLEK